jgi:RNA-directed DNA polymerase
MALLRKLYADLKLQIKEAKSAVASAFGPKVLGYSLWVAKGKEVKCKVAEMPLSNFKVRIRQLTRRSGGRSMEQVVQKLRPYVLGWKVYFGLAQTPRVWLRSDAMFRKAPMADHAANCNANRSELASRVKFIWSVSSKTCIACAGTGLLKK